MLCGPRFGCALLCVDLLLDFLMCQSFFVDWPLLVLSRVRVLGALNLVCAHYLHTHLHSASEGELSRLHSVIISRAACASYVSSLSLSGYLHVGLAAATVTASPGATSSPGNFFEALLGALLVDGGYEAVQTFFDTRLEPLIVERLLAPPQNYRAILANYASVRAMRLVFALTSAPRCRAGSGAGAAADGGAGDDGGGDEDGGDPASADPATAAEGAGFHRVALLDGEEVGAGWGRTLKAADMAAAEVAFRLLRDRGCAIQEAAGVDLRRDGRRGG